MVRQHVPPSRPGEIPCPVCGFIGGYHVEELHRKVRTVPQGSLRTAVHNRDRYICQECGLVMGPKHPDLTLDHHIPRSRGGKNTTDNLVTMCRPCNMAKSDRMPLQSLASRARGG